jgi:anti-sigma factor ChrR (cupin superfamily)
MLQIHSDYTKRAVVRPGDEAFVPSPLAGVDRLMLDRQGGEVARATTIVRYAPGSHFSAHTHGGGEEFLVLSGTFADEHGSYPAGTYVRNPPGSSHAPRSEEGCTLFVKLMQFEPDDRERKVIDTRAAEWLPGLVDGLAVMPLHQFGSESVALVRWAPGTFFKAHTHLGGEEIYVLEGTFEDEHGSYPAGTWLRSPSMSRHQPLSREGCTILVKVGHLPSDHSPPPSPR